MMKSSANSPHSFRSRRCTSRIISPLSGRSEPRIRSCSKLHVSTRLSITVSRRWRKLSQSHENIHSMGSGVMASTAFRMNMFRPGSKRLAPELATVRLIIAHLGNGASLCAIKDGRGVASMMGFTAVDGLMMGTRRGALDPGVLIHLMDQYGFGARELEDFIYRKSGLLGVSGLSSDMRTLRASSERAAKEAIELFIYRIVREIGSLAAALGGLDALVFTGGIRRERRRDAEGSGERLLLARTDARRRGERQRRNANQRAGIAGRGLCHPDK